MFKDGDIIERYIFRLSSRSAYCLWFIEKYWHHSQAKPIGTFLQSCVGERVLIAFDSQKFIHAVQGRKKDIGNGVVRYRNRDLRGQQNQGLSGYLPSDPGIRGRMASIMVTDFTLKLIDEAEKQAKVGQTVQFQKISHLKSTRLIEIGGYDAGPQWETSQLRNMANS